MNRSSHTMAGVMAALLLFTGCNAQPTVAHGSKTSRTPWAPNLSAVSDMHLNLNSTPVSPDLQGPGPFEIPLATVQGRTVAAKVLDWLRQAKPLPMTPIIMPSLGEHALSIGLRTGRSVFVQQYFVRDGAGNFHASPTIVVISTLITASKSSRYRDPALARWLNSGWRIDLAKLAPEWTCSSRRPPSPYQNEIRGAFPNGSPWVFAAGGVRGCVVLYIGRGSRWNRSIVSRHVLAGTQVSVAQAQFIDRLHAFVLVEASPGTGMLPRLVLYRTQDGGATWRIIPPDLSAPFTTSDSTAQMRFSSPLDGWIVALNFAYNPVRVFVYHSKNGGSTWTQTSFTLPEHATTWGRLVAPPPTFQNPQDGTIVVVSQWGGLLIYDTTDGGKHWTFNPLGNG